MMVTGTTAVIGRPCNRYDDPGRAPAVGIMASLAAFERDLIRERTMAGLAAARASGRVGGRPPIMTPDKLDVARQMLAAGKSKTLIARTIGVSRPTLYAHLAGE